MKLVDSIALLYVNPILGLPSTGQTEYDDENLQQVLDIRPWIPGLGTQDGYFSMRLSNVHAATGALDTGLDPYTFVTGQGGALLTHRVWLISLGIWAQGVAGNAINRIEISAVLPVVGGVFPNADARFPLLASATFATTAVTGTSTFFSAEEITATYEQLIRPPVEKLPWPMFPGSPEPLVMRSVASVAAGTIEARAEALFWAGRRGMRPPGM